MIVPWARLRAIVSLSLPIVLILLAQTLMSLINIAMVSHLGDAAVAGIGIGGALFSVLMAVLFGIDTGVQALAAHRTGAGFVLEAGQALTDALPIAAIAGLLLAFTGYLAGPTLLGLTTGDPDVAAAGLSYLNAALPALLFLGAIFAFSAYRNGAGTPRYSLLPVVIQLPCAALFSYLLIFGAFGLPRLGTGGAGLGLTLAALVALGIHVLLALWIAPVPGFLRAPPSRPGMRLILRIGLPVGLQQSLVYVGTAVSFAIVSLLGTGEVAAMNVVLTMMLLSILPASGMGVAAATLVGSALGRGDVGEAKRWGWEVACFGAAGLLALSVVLIAAPRHTLGLFIADQTTLDLASTPLRIMAVGMSIDAFGRILGFALRGAGATRLVTAVAFTLQWGAQLPLSWLVGVYFGLGLLGIAISRLVLFAVEAGIVTMMWRSGFWKRGRLVPGPQASPTPGSSRSSPTSRGAAAIDSADSGRRR
jgi:MATE family, multidrug efflux pump